jgi:hypothetical protein
MRNDFKLIQVDFEYYSSGSWVEFKWNLSIIQVEGPSVLSMRFGGSGEDFASILHHHYMIVSMRILRPTG